MKRWTELAYSYQWDAQGQTVGHRPVVTVMVANGSHSIRVVGLVDSGCDSTMFDTSVAEALQVTPDVSKMISVGGITGTRRGAFQHDVAVRVGEFDPFLTKATFVPNLPFACLLGQRGFFDSFDVRFEKHHQKFYVRPIS